LPYLLLPPAALYSYEMDGVFFEELGAGSPPTTLSWDQRHAVITKIGAIVYRQHDHAIYGARNPIGVLVEGAKPTSVLAARASPLRTSA